MNRLLRCTGIGNIADSIAQNVFSSAVCDIEYMSIIDIQSINLLSNVMRLNEFRNPNNQRIELPTSILIIIHEDDVLENISLINELVKNTELSLGYVLRKQESTKVEESVINEISKCVDDTFELENEIHQKLKRFW